MKALLELKAKYKALTGEDVPGAGSGKSKKDKKKEGKKQESKTESKKEEKTRAADPGDAAGAAKKITRYEIIWQIK